jgi:hypothetical protein
MTLEPHITAADLDELERAVALMRDAGRRTMPVPLTAIERLIAAERRRLGLPARAAT